MKAYGYMRWEAWIISIVHLGAYMAIFYSIDRLLLPRYFEKGKWISFVVGIFICTGLTVGVWFLMLKILCLFLSIYSSTIPNSISATALEAVQMFVPGLILLTWQTIEKQSEEAARLHTLEKEKLTTELNYLKARVNPQFLLGSLSHLKQMIALNDPSSADIILKLSSILDYILYKSNKEKVSLREEIGTIHDYIDLVRSRSTSQPSLNINNEVFKNNLEIAPLTILPLFEKVYNTETDSDLGDIQINIDKSDDYLIITMSSHRAPLLEKSSLDNLQRQLELSYTEEISISTEQHGDTFLQKIKLPVNGR